MVIKTNLKSSIGADADDARPVMFIGLVRKDGKYPVTINYPGERNAFGGRYPAKQYRKLYTAEKIREHARNLYDVRDNSHGTFNATGWE